MEYEFYRDFIDQSPKASFSYGHEVVGFWLEQEIADDEIKLSVLSEQMQQIINNGFGQLQYPGKEFSLEADCDDVVVTANTQLQQYPKHQGDWHQDDDGYRPELEEDQSFMVAQCGSEDFLLMLQRWQEFLR
ncbi:YacL family protein [Thalassotalea mangrovi]|uniref:UPF0231 family protein n=1 Tax=Thalassotalea mangrovi TaxID=2572245 RepID=A0A4U1B8R4_9GAMM|nr:YacL family protein [Thalassotalea mangrovi]TKB47080.1 UPF0231 family protein [Thalassotalea mangrovi]